MQRKPGYPPANNMKMEFGLGMEYVTRPDLPSEGPCDEDEPQQRRLQLINFGHSQWGFNNWSWSVTSQVLDFAEPFNGKYSAGVACFVSIKVKSLDIQRDNVGYATSVASNKGLAIHRARKCAVTNALRETLLSFGGNVATDLVELLEGTKNEAVNHITVPEVVQEGSQNLLHKTEPKNMAKPNIRKDSETNIVNIPLVYPQKGPKNIITPPVAKAHPMPINLPAQAAAAPGAGLPPAANAGRPPFAPAPPAHARPNSNEEDAAEAARAQRKQRQRQAKEEFLKKQMEQDDNQDSSNNVSNVINAEKIPSNDEREVSGSHGKRKSPDPRGMRNVRSKFDDIGQT